MRMQHPARGKKPPPAKLRRFNLAGGLVVHEHLLETSIHGLDFYFKETDFVIFQFSNFNLFFIY